jgi:hypothetical protein
MVGGPKKSPSIMLCRHRPRQLDCADCFLPVRNHARCKPSTYVEEEPIAQIHDHDTRLPYSYESQCVHPNVGGLESLRQSSPVDAGQVTETERKQYLSERLSRGAIIRDPRSS